MNSKNYLNAAYGLKSWLLTTDHKRIALLYLVTITLMFILGGLAASVVRMELITPDGNLVEAQTYNQLFTAHAIFMVFFFLIPSIPTVFGNFFLPMMLGARDLAFPRLNLASWYIFVLGTRWPCGASSAAGSIPAGPSMRPLAPRPLTPTSSRWPAGSSSPGSRRSSPGLISWSRRTG